MRRQSYSSIVIYNFIDNFSAGFPNVDRFPHRTLRIFLLDFVHDAATAVTKPISRRYTCATSQTAMLMRTQSEVTS
jgi:hypothetical protein